MNISLYYIYILHRNGMTKTSKTLERMLNLHYVFFVQILGQFAFQLKTKYIKYLFFQFVFSQ